MVDVNFAPGDYVDAFGQPAKIVDVLKSEYTGSRCLFVRFARNFGNARSFDMLEVTSETTNGIPLWTKISKEQYTNAIKRRIEVLQKEIND